MQSVISVSHWEVPRTVVSGTASGTYVVDAFAGDVVPWLWEMALKQCRDGRCNRPENNSSDGALYDPSAIEGRHVQNRQGG